MAAALLAWFQGAAQRPIAVATALATLPALVGFAVAPNLKQTNYAALLVAVWLGVAAGLAAMTGGGASPLVVLFAVGPILAWGVAPAWVWQTVAGSVFCYVAANAIAPQFDGTQLRVFGPALSIGALGLLVVLSMLRSDAPNSNGASASQAIAEVSHELRTPLTHILGFSEMIERQIYGPINERYVEYAGLIRASGTHLLEMVNDLLDLSRIEAGRYELKRERFDVHDAIADILRQFSVAAQQKSIMLSMRVADAPLRVSADARALKRILINTIGNALKFTPTGGQVTVSATVLGESVVLDTIDNGPGIPEAERARLGSAYERGASGDFEEGTGLGLSLVRALAALHGGSLSFHEAPGGGALVRVTLPIVAED